MDIYLGKNNSKAVNLERKIFFNKLCYKTGNSTSKRLKLEHSLT